MHAPMLPVHFEGPPDIAKVPGPEAVRDARGSCPGPIGRTSGGSPRMDAPWGLKAGAVWALVWVLGFGNRDVGLLGPEFRVLARFGLVGVGEFSCSANAQWACIDVSEFRVPLSKQLVSRQRAPK